MLIKIENAPSVAGGKAIMLCDDQGEPLPMQVRSVLSAGVNEVGEITVTFSIDGDRVRFAD